MSWPVADSTETQRLLRRIREGDDGAFDQLFARHRPYLHRAIAWRLDANLRPRLDPSDLVQETQMQAAQGLTDYLHSVSLPFRLWLRRIAQDRLIMARRQHVDAAKRTVLRELPLPEGSSVVLGQQLLSAAASPSQQLVRKEMARQVRHAITQLPDTDREIVLLVSFEGLTSHEAAHVLGLNPAAIRKRFGRALVKLREILDEEGLQESSL